MTWWPRPSGTSDRGIACLYGGGQDCGDNDNLYPASGVGVQYLLKPKEGIVINLEYAVGKNDNQGVYLKMGYGSRARPRP